MFNNEDILNKEIDSILKDVIALYERSGKKVTGNFAQQLDVKVDGNSGQLLGVEYLSGREPGKMPPTKEIEAWIKRKGIAGMVDEAKISGLAYIIARKIAKEGTKDSGIDVYAEVITPARIDTILKKISSFNAMEFVEAVQDKLKQLN